MIEENLDQFFDTSAAGHAQTATFKTAAGSTIREASVIFTDALGIIENGDTDSEAALPFISCSKADLANVDHSCKVVIGLVTYRIIRIAGDGVAALVLLQP